MKIILPLVILIISQYTPITCQEKKSPCPRVFTYDLNTDTSDTWHGTLHLDTQIKLYGIYVDLVFDRPVTSLSVSNFQTVIIQNRDYNQPDNTFYYEVNNSNNVDFKIEDTRYELDVGEMLNLRFTVKYYQYGKIPLIKEIRFNGQRICESSSSRPSIAEVNSRKGETNRSTSTTHIVQPISDEVRPIRASSLQPETKADGTQRNSNQRQNQQSNQNSFSGNDDTISISIHPDETINNNNRITTTTARRPSGINSFNSNNENSFNRPSQNFDNDGDSRTTRRPVNTQRPSFDNFNHQSNGETLNNNVRTSRRPSGTNANSFNGSPEDNSNVFHRPNSRQTTTNPPKFFQGDLSFSKGDSAPHSVVTNSGESTCGTVAAKASPLIVFGETSAAAQFPWHTAIYLSTVEQLKYICGGVLISRRAVLTAAHCVCIERSETPVNTDSLLVYLGKYNLRKWTGPEQDGKISQIIVHPDYDHTKFYSDIAILKLKDNIIIDNYVRPVCLWNQNTDLKLIVDKLGHVPGWGYNENGVVNEVLTFVRMPVVAHETCIWSNRDFFSRVTSDRAFCAGFRNETSVCNGDSGGGMVFKNNNQWFLRGLVSVSVALQNKLRCDPSEYAVFTDVSKFLPWISENM